MYERTPTFFLASKEYPNLIEPRACFEDKKLHGRTGAEFMLVRVEPGIEDVRPFPTGRVLRRVVLGSRFVEDTLYPVSRWPLHVYVYKLKREDAHLQADTWFQGATLIAWAAVYRTMEAARSAVWSA